MNIFIIDRDERKLKYLYPYFDGCDNVEFAVNDFESFMKTNSHRIDCVVSPANSFGLMDGGYDLALTNWYGNQLQERVQNYIIEHFLGEQPVATSFIIEAGKDNQFLIHTPTMRTPEVIVDARIIYQCMRTTLLTAIQNNIKNVLIPLFGASTGMVKPQIVAKMMWKAYEQINNPPAEINWDYVENIDILPETDFLQNNDQTNF